MAKEIYGKSPGVDRDLKMDIFVNKLFGKRLKELEREKSKKPKERKA